MEIVDDCIMIMIMMLQKYCRKISVKLRPMLRSCATSKTNAKAVEVDNLLSEGG
jgi:hypothetical protein